MGIFESINEIPMSDAELLEKAFPGEEKFELIRFKKFVAQHLQDNHIPLMDFIYNMGSDENPKLLKLKFVDYIDDDVIRTMKDNDLVISTKNIFPDMRTKDGTITFKELWGIMRWMYMIVN